MSKHSFTHTNFMNVDVPTITPMPDKFIVYVDEEEMLKIPNTDLILGYWEDNRNNSHWYGDVVTVGKNVPLKVGERVIFSFLSARGCDRIRSHNKLYIILDFSYSILSLDNGNVNMLNGFILGLTVPPVKHETLEFLTPNPRLVALHHVPKDSKYSVGDVVYYRLEQEYELEGQHKLLRETYRVLREYNILGRLYPLGDDMLAIEQNNTR